MSVRSRCLLAVVAALSSVAIAACDARPFGPGGIVVSYAERTSGCEGCPSFIVDIREDGAVTFFGREGCAVPGEQQFRIPASEFRDLVDTFHNAAFFSIPRQVGEWFSHGTVVQLRYADDRRIHETRRTGEGPSRLHLLEKRLRRAARVERFLTPSVEMYRSLLRDRWNINTEGQDHENAVTASVNANDVEAVRFLIEHGGRVTDGALWHSLAPTDPFHDAFALRLPRR